MSKADAAAEDSGPEFADAESWSRGDTTDYKFLRSNQRDALQAIGVLQAQAPDGLAKRHLVEQALGEFYGGGFADRALEDIVGVLRSDGLVRRVEYDNDWVGYELTQDGAEALRAARDRLDSACEVIDA